MQKAPGDVTIIIVFKFALSFSFFFFLLNPGYAVVCGHWIHHHVIGVCFALIF
jgi:hypothetical protein